MNRKAHLLTHANIPVGATRRGAMSALEGPVVIAAVASGGKTMVMNEILRRGGYGISVVDLEMPSMGMPESAGARSQRRLSSRDVVDEIRAKRRRDEQARLLAEDRIRRPLERLASDHGGIVSVTSVRREYHDTYAITLIQWLGHGLGGRRIDSVSFGDHNTEVTDELIEETLRRKYAKSFARQMILGETLGRAVEPTAGDVDLSRYTIEQPLAAALHRAYGDAAPDRLREIIAKGPEGYLSDLKGGAGHGISQSITIKVSRGVIRGEFEVDVDDRTSIVWSKGGLRIKDLIVPETIAMGLAKDSISTIGGIIDHPLFEGSIAVTSTQPVFKSNRLDVAMCTKGSEIAVPANWIG